MAPANDLRRYLPGIELQPKGLLATEAFVTIPIISLTAPALAIRSHFFEFQSAEDVRTGNAARPLLAHELSQGGRYQVIVTTDGGLYRYQLHDEVEVVGFKAQAPLLRFLGKADETSDLVGEKLNAAHVHAVLKSSFQTLRLWPTYVWLRADPSSHGYILQIAALSLLGNRDIQRRLCQLVEAGLRSNPAYSYARFLGQLCPLELEVLEQHEADALTAAETIARVADGQRLGDIKPATLSTSVAQ